jgi:hypothetical protein
MKFGRYRSQVVQKLLPRDEVARVEFCNRLLGNLNEDSGVLNNVLTRDEAHLQVSYFVIKQNMRYRAPVYPREMRERPLHSPKVSLRCAVETFENVGLLFSDIDENVTVNDEGCKTFYRICKHLVQ